MEPSAKDVYVDLISKLIRLTVEGRLAWNASVLRDTERTDGRRYTASYKGQTFSLTTLPRTARIDRSKGFGLPIYMGEEYSLEVTRPSKETILFPRLTSLSNLADAIYSRQKSQVAEISRLLD